MKAKNCTINLVKKNPESRYFALTNLYYLAKIGNNLPINRHPNTSPIDTAYSIFIFADCSNELNWAKRMLIMCFDWCQPCFGVADNSLLFFDPTVL